MRKNKNLQDQITKKKSDSIPISLNLSHKIKRNKHVKTPFEFRNTRDVTQFRSNEAYQNCTNNNQPTYIT